MSKIKIRIRNFWDSTGPVHRQWVRERIRIASLMGQNWVGVYLLFFMRVEAKI
jgi:hypothetical protein